MKTQKTKDLERLLADKFVKRNDFFVFECTIGWNGAEIVDCIMYNCQRETTCYEIKQSVSDFHSKNKLTFIGNYNYYVMPYSLYQKVKNEIPYDIGCLVAIDHLEDKEEITTNQYGATFKKMWKEPVDGLKELYKISNPKRQELKADKEVILSSMLRSMQRDRMLKFDIDKLLQEEADLATKNKELRKHIDDLEDKIDDLENIAKS